MSKSGIAIAKQLAIAKRICRENELRNERYLLAECKEQFKESSQNIVADLLYELANPDMSMTPYKPMVVGPLVAAMLKKAYPEITIKELK